MLKQRGRVHQNLIVFGSSLGSIGHLATGLWRRDSGRRWLVPLAVFLAVSGIVLAIAATVDALGPFIYSIF